MLDKTTLSLLKPEKKIESIILMHCLCHIARNAVSKATKAFVKVVNNCDVEELLVDIYFQFHYSSKHKNMLSFVNVVISNIENSLSFIVFGGLVCQLV